VLRYHLGYLLADLQQAKRQFNWQSLHTLNASKTALAVTLAVLVAYLIQAQDVFWAGITAVVMMQPNVGASFEKGFHRILGTLTGAMVGLLVLGFFYTSPYLLFTISFALVFYTSCQFKHSTYSYSWIVANGTYLMVVYSSLLTPELDITIAFYRCLEIVIGVLVAHSVNLLIFPQHAQNQLARGVSQLINIVSQTSPLLQSLPLARQNAIKPIGEFSQGINKCRALLKSAQQEAKTINPQQPKAALVRCQRLIHCLADISQLNPGIYDDPGHQDLRFHALFNDLTRDMQQDLRQLLDQLAKDIVQHQYPASYPQLAKLNKHLVKCRRRLDRLRKKKIHTRFQVTDTLALHHLLATWQQTIEELTKALTPQAEPTEPATPAKPIGLTQYLKKHFIKTTDTHKLALKIALASTLAPVLWLQLDLPGGMGALITVIAVCMQHNITDVQHKGLLRMLGCLLGGALGILVLGFGINSLLLLLALLFIGTGLFAYIFTSGGGGSSYMGLQAGVAYLITLVNSTGPALSLSPAIERLTGILLGLVIISLIFNFIWPEKTANKLLELTNTINQASREFVNQLVSAILANQPATFDLADTNLQATLEKAQHYAQQAAKEGSLAKRPLIMIKRIQQQQQGLYEQLVKISTSAPIQWPEDNELKQAFNAVLTATLSYLTADSNSQATALEKQQQAVNKLLTAIRHKSLTWPRKTLARVKLAPLGLQGTYYQAICRLLEDIRHNEQKLNRLLSH
jgi:uncharacterized membrane protein YccC